MAGVQQVNRPLTPEILDLAARNLCNMRGVDPDTKPDEASPSFKDICAAEIVGFVQANQALQLANQNRTHTGEQVKPIFFDTNGKRLQ
jgi:hypothetical protein